MIEDIQESSMVSARHTTKERQMTIHQMLRGIKKAMNGLGLTEPDEANSVGYYEGLWLRGEEMDKNNIEPTNADRANPQIMESYRSSLRCRGHEMGVRGLPRIALAESDLSNPHFMEGYEGGRLEKVA